VVLTRGLLAKTEGPDEIAGVLAHELEHVRQRHVMAQIIRTSILSLGWSVTVGDFSDLMIVDPGTAFAIANQRFPRADERAADAGALDRLDRARIGRAGFAAFFRRLQADSDNLPAWLSTHPASAERLQTIGTASAPGVTPALTDAAWSALRAACADRPPSG
jgi:beta-barrel assembly-enhancing protease